MSTLTTPTPSLEPQPPAGNAPSLLPGRLAHSRPLFDPEIVRRASVASFQKLNPGALMKNPVIFVVEVGAILTTVFLIRDFVTAGGATGVSVANHPVALVYRAVCQLRRSDG